MVVQGGGGSAARALCSVATRLNRSFDFFFGHRRIYRVNMFEKNIAACASNPHRDYALTVPCIT